MNPVKNAAAASGLHCADTREVDQGDERREDGRRDGVDSERRFKTERRTPERHCQSAGEPDDERSQRKQKDGLRIGSDACHGSLPRSGLGGHCALPVLRYPSVPTTSISNGGKDILRWINPLWVDWTH